MFRMLPRLLSIRQFRCYFLAAVIVCAIMAVAAIHLRPKSLVNFLNEQSEDEEKALSLPVTILQTTTSDTVDDVDKRPESVKFLPATEAATQNAEAEVAYKRKQLPDRSTGIVHQVIDGSPVYYGNVVPAYTTFGIQNQFRGVQEGEVMKVGQAGNHQSQGGVYYSQQQMQAKDPAAKEPPPFVPERRLIHFDLKGAPPKIEFLLQVMEIAAKLGATGILIEYEDMFPYEGSLKSISASNHYSKADVKTLLAAAAANHLEVIPLVQTFGHLEYALKLQEFAPLRENPDVPQAICPSRNESLRLVESLVDQIMALHEGISYLHIGCDEVFHMAECSVCSMKNRDELFLGHVRYVAKYVRNKYKVTPIIWDDMMRHISTRTLIDSEIGKLVEPMVWVYAENVYHFTGPEVYQRYSEVFPSFWVSSAFKGAFGETLVVPDVKRHLDNNLKWLQVSEAESLKFKQGLRGMVITGWQRYDHFATLCELMPAAVPSMSVNLLAVSKGYYNDSLAPLLYSALSCSKSPKYDRVPDLQFGNDRFLFDKMSMCFFPGAPFFKLIGRFVRVEKEVHEFVHVTTERRGWLTDFNLRHNFTSPARIDELVRDLAYHAGSLHTLAKQTMETLKPVFDAHTISEWMEQKLLPLFKLLDHIQTAAQQLRARKYWPPRPLKRFDSWDYYGIKIEEEAPSVKPVTYPAH